MGNGTDWAALVADKRARCKSMIPEDWRLSKDVLDLSFQESEVNAIDLLTKHNLLTGREKEITEKYDAVALLKLLTTGAITSLEVCTAFCKRAAIAHQLVNCGTEIFFAEAFERARIIDEYWAKEKKPIGPFHGLPISVKDSFNVKGQASTLGYVSFLQNPIATENSHLIDIVLENGGVLYMKTNVPQTLLTMDTVNNVFGRTLNPHKLLLGAGGSSGGEGALVGFRGSILGIGTDIGGSIRVPSLCCGTYGFKPSADRIPYGKQQRCSRPGNPGIAPSAGPHATSASDLTYFVRNVLLCEPWKRDSTALAIPWRDLPEKKVLTIGVLSSDVDYPVTPPITRAIQSAERKLRDAGHNVIHMSDFPSMKRASTIAARFYMLDNNHTSIKFAYAGGEKLIDALSYASPAKYAEARDSTLDDLWKSNVALSQYMEDLRIIWHEKNLDILLCPAAASTAVPHDNFGWPAYTLIWNLLNFPASVLPYLHADKLLDSNLIPGYNADIVESAPCSMQIVGWRYQDEEVLRATEIVAEVLKM